MQSANFKNFPDHIRGRISPWKKEEPPEEITFTGATPPANITGNAFENSYVLETVWVPAGTLEAYTTALSGKLPSGAVIKEIIAEEPALSIVTQPVDAEAALGEDYCVITDAPGTRVTTETATLILRAK